MSDDWYGIINEFRSIYGNADKENTLVYRDGKLVGRHVGSKHSSSFGSDIRNADTIHNHPTNTPAFSESDIIMTLYGNANSMTTVSQDRGAWILTRPAGGWPQHITHTMIENSYKKNKMIVMKSPKVKQITTDYKNHKLTFDDANGKISELWVKASLYTLGLKRFLTEVHVKI
jgi:hypothetical protein